MIIINILQLIFLSLWTIFIVYICAPFLNYNGAWYITTHWWAGGCARILFSKIKIEGLENLDPKQHYIFMANHSSYFDIACLFYATKRRLHFIAKQELGRQFFTGYMLRKLKIIFIDRSNALRSATSMRQAIETIKSGKDIAIFPEGTRTKTGKLGVFKKGGFKMAIQSQTPIVPVVIENSAKAWARNNITFRPATVVVRFCKPVETAHLTENDAQILSEKVRGSFE
ncbi:MAG: 1-acyl-sn-glycerol-3-phosphate acyltransferase [Bacteroidetes bacterium]|nr:1-acyl-sn-glycerol-3-phosphate acyltransferase [Bacteroidota bacterium]